MSCQVEPASLLLAAPSAPTATSLSGSAWSRLSGLLIGLPTFRLRGHYFALAMLAYPLALLNIFLWLGHQEVSLPLIRERGWAYMQFADHRVYILLVVGLLLATMIAIFALMVLKPT